MPINCWKIMLAFGWVVSGAFLPPAALCQVPSTRLGVIVLDDCDPVYQGKAKYEDNLSFIRSSGVLEARVTGLNICEEIGSPHRIAVDARRKRVWVAETVGHRLLAYDLAGNRILSIPNIQASALAVDPATGNVWVARSTGRIGYGSIEVFDHSGRSVAVHDFYAYDIAYDAKENAFWLVGKELLKVTLDGKVVVRKHIAEWCAISVAVNSRVGSVWVVTREHSKGLGDNQLLEFDSAGKLLHTIPLGNKVPFRVAVDSRDGAVWVTEMRKALLRFSASGKLEKELPLPGLAAEVEEASGNIWVVTAQETLKVDSVGKVLSRTPHAAKTSQAWIATYTAARELTHKGPALQLPRKDLDELWAELANADFAKADNAWQKLGAVGDNAMAFYRERIRSTAVPPVDLKRIEKLVSELDADKFAIRENATKELLATGEVAIPLLTRLAEKPGSLESQKRAMLIVEKLVEPTLTPERIRVLSAIDLLEELQTANAIALLQEIERDALVPCIGREARQALQRLEPKNSSKKD